MRRRSCADTTAPAAEGHHPVAVFPIELAGKLAGGRLAPLAAKVADRPHLVVPRARWLLAPKGPAGLPAAFPSQKAEDPGIHDGGQGPGVAYRPQPVGIVASAILIERSRGARAGWQRFRSLHPRVDVLLRCTPETLPNGRMVASVALPRDGAFARGPFRCTGYRRLTRNSTRSRGAPAEDTMTLPRTYLRLQCTTLVSSCVMLRQGFPAPYAPGAATATRQSGVAWLLQGRDAGGRAFPRPRPHAGVASNEAAEAQKACRRGLSGYQNRDRRRSRARRIRR